MHSQPKLTIMFGHHASGSVMLGRAHTVTTGQGLRSLACVRPPQRGWALL